MRATDCVSKKIIERAKSKKWWLFARALDEMLYNGGTVSVEPAPGASSFEGDRIVAKKDEKKYAHRFICSAEAYIGQEIPSYVRVLGREEGSSMVNVEKMLRDLMLECERMAILEASDE